MLDPLEVADVCVWPLDLKSIAREERSKTGGIVNKETPELVFHLNDAEYTICVKLLEESRFKAVLNEKLPVRGSRIALPEPHRGCIIPSEFQAQRKHPDVRIARRAGTIAALARVISEREVEAGLRQVLLLQARRLEFLAAQRLRQFGGDADDQDPSGQR